MRKNEKGFTLVELAVVMVIIGLLVGGVLKAVNMIEQARVNAVITYVNEIDAAINLFRDQYRSLPGDDTAATNKVPGCGDAANFCVNGDGNGRIASDNGDRHTWVSKIVGSPYESEGTQFWKHLALAGIIGSVNPSADPANPSWGGTHPETVFGGGFEMYYDAIIVTGGGADRGASSHVLRASENGIFSGGTEGSMTTSNAQFVDKKMDDGDPNQGIVIADYGARNGNDCKRPGTDPGYKTENRTAVCILFFRLLAR